MVQHSPNHGTSVCPYIMVDAVEDEMNFLITVFDAVVVENATNSEGVLWHGKILLDNTVIMIGRIEKEALINRNMTFVYVDNVEKTYVKALKNGAKSIEAPTDRIYGAKVGGFIDNFGHQWWIGEILEQLSDEEIYIRNKKNLGVKK